MQKCKKYKKYKNKNSLAPAISIKKQNRVKRKSPKDTKKCLNAKRVNQLKCTKTPPRRQLLIYKKRKKRKKILKNAKTQKEKNMQKEQQNKNKCTFASAISTSYLLFFG